MTDQILLSMVRRVWPNIIANSIIGVQPMHNSVDSALILILKDELIIKLDNTHYRHFVRIYNRRKYHSINYINSLGYYCIAAHGDTRTWCTKHIKQGAWFSLFHLHWFAYETDATIFSLTWE